MSSSASIPPPPGILWSLVLYLPHLISGLAEEEPQCPSP
ncbi:hypothetical protein TIFTF001_055699, partial [Ficus carica]